MSKLQCKLKEILVDQGRSQKWLCEKVDLSNTSMSLIVNGETEPRLKIALRISKVVGVPVEVIWWEDVDK